jgi:DNA-binding phage protein
VYFRKEREILLLLLGGSNKKGHHQPIMQLSLLGKNMRAIGSKALKKRRGLIMPLTKLFKDTVKARVERDPAFGVALFQEALSAFFEGDTALGKSLLRDLVNSTIGFEGLAQEMNKPSKSLHRMLAPSGNPTMENFFQVIHVIQKNEGINFQLNVLAKKKARVRQKVHA